MPVARPLLLLAAALALAAPAAAHGAERARLAWTVAGADVDLHVFDERGHRAWYGDPDGIPDAALSRDVTRGPGEERLTDARTPSRRRFAYGVCYYAMHGPGTPPPVPVTLELTDPGGARRTVGATLAAPGAHALLDAGGAAPDAAAALAAGDWCDDPGRDPAPPRAVRAPAIAGLAVAGGTLRCDPGRWSGAPRTFGVAWRRDDGADLGERRTYAPQEADAGHAVRCLVTATSPGGSATAASERVVVRTADALARRFRPRLRFDSTERWRPVAATALLAERVGGRPAHAVCRPVRPLRERPDRCAPGTSAPVHGPASLAAADDPDAILDLNADGVTTPPGEARSPDPACAGPLRDCDAGPSAAIHHRLARAGAYAVLDYWLLYRYSDAPYSVRGLPGPGRLLDTDHEGDWEGVAVAVSADDPDPRTFDWAAYAAHAGPPRRYLRATLSCDGDPRPGSCAAPGAARPHVYVAAGTHASYPAPCHDRGVAALGLPGPAGRALGRWVLGCRQRGVDGPVPAGVLPEGGHDGARPWGADDDPAALRPLAPGDGVADWAGRWGLPGATRSPARQWDARVRPVAAAARARASGASGAAGAGTARPAQAAAAAESDPAAGGGDATSCADWLGEHVAVAVCDEGALRAAFAAGTLGRAGDVTIDGGPGRAAASAPGIAQLAGGPLAAGEAVTVTPAAAPAPGTLLVARAVGAAGAIEVTVPLAGLAPGTPVVVRAGDGPRAPVAVRAADG
ncbi:MAG: hypothetical protein IRZ32_18260, partial [Solirubrobacteraceae bacterium]|nr:hypothetical protein [Solirubrobacteraceae bacterium]